MTTEQSAQALEPAIVAAARALCKRASEDCGVNEEDNWALYGDSFRKDAEAALIAAAPHQPAAAQLEPPLLGRWHHGEGYLVSGTIRISRWDCDTNPPPEFRDKLLNWVCETLNAAVKQWEAAAPDPFADPTQPKEPSNG